MAFTSLKIENFRGIKSLEMSDLGRVNVLAGKNNSGKTSVLEAICSGNGGHSQDFSRDITKPTLVNSRLHDMPLLFRNLDVQNHIRIQTKHQDT
jgi:AAA15 family ATPase/GTPase